MSFMHREGPIEKRRYAKRLRREQTDAERALWAKLHGRQLAGVKFRRQEPIGPYIVDFVSYGTKLIVELDGGHHNKPAEQVKDRERSAWLEGQGFRVIRFWNTDILWNVEGVLAEILEELGAAGDSPSPWPSPIEGEGTTR